MPTVKVLTRAYYSCMTGRNGTYDIESVLAWSTSGLYGGQRQVFIDAISAKKKVKLNGGITMDEHAFTELCREWIRQIDSS